VVIWVCIVIGFGMFTKLSQKFLRHLTKVAQLIRYFHMLIAYSLIVYTHIVILAGLFFFDSPVTYLFYIHIGCIVACYIVFETINQIKSKWKYKELMALDHKNLKTITIQEFNQFIKEGKKYVLYNNYVLNVSWFRFEHPGTSYAIDSNIGKDIGKFFYGAYTMENYVGPHTHSYVASKILIKLACAKIANPKEGVIIIDEHVESENNTVKNPAQNPGNIFKVKEKSELIHNIFRIKLGNNIAKIKCFYPGLELAGRSYIVNSIQNQVCRYYTICNCMNTKFYDTYIDAFDSILNGTPRNLKSLNFENILDETSDEIELIMKYYPQTRKGISRQLVNATNDDYFYINAPVNKGLDFGGDVPVGTIIILVGGTGVLPFMDLLAYTARSLIAEKSNQGPIFEGEKFHDDISKASIIVYSYNHCAEHSI